MYEVTVSPVRDNVKELVQLEQSDWRKSGFSYAFGNCVEVASAVSVRDTADRQGPVLRFTPGAWQEFTRGLKGHAEQAV